MVADLKLININGEEYNFNSFVKNLAKKDIKEVTRVFLENNITIPRVLNVCALRSLLNTKVIVAKELNVSEEVLYRLRNYPNFNETQLQEFFIVLNLSDADYLTYKENLFKLLYLNKVILNISDNIFEQLLNLNNDNVIFYEYEHELSNILYDYENEFDGISLETYDFLFLKAVTLSLLHDIADKYHIILPKRLRKEDMLIYIKEVLTDRNVTSDKFDNIDSMSSLALSRFAKNHQIRVSTDLKKDEALDYLLFQHNKCPNIKPKLDLDLSLGSDFVFDLAYVTKVEEVIPVVEPEVAPIEKVEEKPVEVVKEVVKVLEKEATPLEQPTYNPQINATININVEDLSKLIVENTKILVSELTKQFNSTQVQPVVVETKEEKVENIYPYNNFSNTINPYYDESVADRIKKDNIEKINPELKNVDTLIVQTEVDEDESSYLTEEEKRQLKLDEKAKKKQDKIDQKQLSKEEKEKLKLAKKEEEEKAREARIEAKIKEKEELKRAKIEQKASAKAEAKRLKQEEKDSIIAAKLARKEEARKKNEAKVSDRRNYTNLMKAVDGRGDITNIDSDFIDKEIKLKQYKRLIADEERAKNDRRRHRVGVFFKLIFLLIFLVALAYVGISLFIVFAGESGANLEKALLSNDFMKQIFDPLINWLRSFTN